MSFKKRVGVLPRHPGQNFPNGLWPSWPPNHPLIGFITLVSSPPISWCVVGVLAHYGCRRIIQVDAAHWWWLRSSPLQCKALWVSRKALYKCNKLLLLLLKTGQKQQESKNHCLCSRCSSSSLNDEEPLRNIRFIKWRQDGTFNKNKVICSFC